MHACMQLCQISFASLAEYPNRMNQYFINTVAMKNNIPAMFSYFIRHGTKARITYETYIYGSVLFQVALISLRI